MRQHLFSLAQPAARSNNSPVRPAAIAPQPQPIQRQPLFRGLSFELSQLQLHEPTLSASGGKKLPEAVQQKMEAAFNADFSSVRIHEGTAAPSIDAIAFTRGSNIHFAPGKYDPISQAGQQLLGHELAHVIQQRSGRVALPQNGCVNVDRALEQEADAVGAKAAAGESIAIAGAASTTGNQQMPVQRKKRLTDRDRDMRGRNQDKIAGGAINSVDLVTYKRGIGKSTTRTGYFKEDLQADPGEAAKAIGIDPDQPNLANRAVATSRYAALLMDKKGRGAGSTITPVEFAKHNDKKGTVSAEASGRPVKKLVDDVVTIPALLQNLRSKEGPSYMKDPRTGKVYFRVGDSNKREDPNDFYKIDAHDYYYNIDYSNPETQKGLTDLQIIDALTGQVDRHGGNIFIDDQGKVSGIDHDASFGGKAFDPRKLAATGGNFDPMKDSHNSGLPPLVDEDTAEMILALDPKRVKKELQDLLSEQEISATLMRLAIVKSHIQNLYLTGGVVGAPMENKVQHPLTWGASTYATLTNSPQKSYVQNLASRYQRGVQLGPQHAQMPPQPANVVPIAQSQNQVAPVAVNANQAQAIANLVPTNSLSPTSIDPNSINGKEVQDIDLSAALNSMNGKQEIQDADLPLAIEEQNDGLDAVDFDLKEGIARSLLFAENSEKQSMESMESSANISTVPAQVSSQPNNAIANPVLPPAVANQNVASVAPPKRQWLVERRPNQEYFAWRKELKKKIKETWNAEEEFSKARALVERLKAEGKI